MKKLVILCSILLLLLAGCWTAPNAPETIAFDEFDSADWDWQNAEFRLNSEQFGIPCNVGPISTQEEAETAGKAILESCQGKHYLMNCSLTRVVHFTQDHIWMFEYSEELPADGMTWISGGTFVMVSEDGELIQAWAEEG